MPTDFQWITDHDDWSPLVPEPAGPGRRRLPGGRALLLVILALLVGTGLVAGQVDRALQILADRQVADVLGVYTLLLRAEQQQDLELFVSILSARSPNWAQVQKELFSLGWLTASPQLGLEPASDRTVPRPEPAAVSLSADMAAAELTVVRPYHFPAGDGELETVALRHTLVFRRGDDRWLLAPPMPEFWGEWREEDWGGLHVVFPARDTHLVQRLTVDLAGLLAGLCRDLACPDSLSLQLRFDRDPAVFLAMRDWPAYLQTGPFINLPAPGLIGEPVDELAYQALLRLYAGLALPAAMARLTGEPCCGSGLLSQAISERYLVALGLRPETLDAGAYRDFLNAPLALQELEALWRAPAEFRHDDQRWPVALMLVDYAAGYPSGLRGPAATVRRPGATIRRPGATIRRPAAVIQVFAALNQASSLAGWLAQSTGRPASGLATLTEWLLYVESQAKPAGVTAPLPLPPQHIGLICHAETGAGRSTHVFYRLDPATGGLETEAVFDQYVQAFALNQGQAVIIQESRGRPSMGRTLLWRDGSVITVADSRQGDTLVFVADWLFPSDRRIPLVVQTARRRADLEPLAGAILDLDHCTADSCPLRQVAGYPDFSPDGRWILLSDPSLLGAGGVRLADAEGRVAHPVSDVGSAPFWLDNQRFAIVLDQEIRLGSLPGGATIPLLAIEDLLELPGLPGRERASQLYFLTGLADPLNPDWIFLTLYDRQWRTFYLVRYDLAADELLLIHTAFRNWIFPTFSPDGRWLTLEFFGEGNMNKRLVILPLHARGAGPMTLSKAPLDRGRHAWSADGTTLVTIHGNFLRFTAPDTGRHRLAFLPPNLGCRQAFWVDPIEGPGS